MPKETPHRQTSPPASRGGYNGYADRGRGAYTRGRGNTGGYGARGQAYQQYGGGYNRGRGGGQRGGYPAPAMGMQPPPVNTGMNMQFGMLHKVQVY